jgi:hypothetical protein
MTITPAYPLVRKRRRLNIGAVMEVRSSINLIQPSYNPLMSIFAGVVGGLVTGVIALLGVYKTLRYNAEQEERKRQYELKRQAYFEYIDQIVRGRRILEKGFQGLGNKNEFEKWKPGFDAAKIKLRAATPP